MLNFADAKQISYDYKTEIVFGAENGFELPRAIEEFVKNEYRYLNESKCFKTSFVRDVVAVRAHHLDPNNLDRGQLVSVTTEDGIEIKCTYFDRGSDKLVVTGAGFTNEREIMAPFVKMFENYDVVIFDYRGHGFDPAYIGSPSSWINCNLAMNTFGIDSRYSKLGEIEEYDVAAVVKGFRGLKNYQSVYGVSVCMGSFLFLKAEAMYPGLFDRIVVDGCWDTLGKMIDKFRHDLKLVCKPQTGGWKDYWLSKQVWYQDALLWLARNVWALNIGHDVRLCDHLPNIKNTPVLFFYGKNDLTVYRDEFEELWNTLPVPYKAAIITSNPHVMNQYKSKELYKYACEVFFQSASLDEFAKNFMVPVNPPASVEELDCNTWRGDFVALPPCEVTSKIAGEIVLDSVTNTLG